MFFEILFIAVFYAALMIAASYYVNLFTTKDQYTKDEIKNVGPFLSQLWNIFLNKYSAFYLILIIAAAIFVGGIFPLLSKGWIINSSLIFVLIYFAVPVARSSFEKTQVTASEEYSDNVVNIFVKYSDVIIFGFGIGYGASLIYSWAAGGSVYFLWFLLNIVIITVLLIMQLKKMIQHS